MHTKVRERPVKTFLGVYESGRETKGVGGVFDTTEELVDRVGVVDPTGVDAEADNEILADGDGVGDMQREFEFDVGLGEPALGAVGADRNRAVERITQPGAVGVDSAEGVITGRPWRRKRGYGTGKRPSVWKP